MRARFIGRLKHLSVLSIEGECEEERKSIGGVKRLSDDFSCEKSAVDVKCSSNRPNRGEIISNLSRVEMNIWGGLKIDIMLKSGLIDC